MKFYLPFSLLAALPFALAAPMCSVRPSASRTAPSTTASGVPPPSSIIPATPSPTPSSSPPSTGGVNTTTTGTTSISMAWFADWHQNFTISDINWSDFNVMSFFTAQPSSNLDVELLGVDTSMISQFVSAAHSHNVQAVVTVGGWSGSNLWSSSVATDQNRTTFATNVAKFATQYSLDGIDFDWEYPGKQGAGCNIVSPNDSANFLSFIQTLRQQAPNLKLSAATGITPWVDASGSPMTDVSGFAKVLDWIEIMNYDVFGGFSSVTGPNAPLDDSCSPHASGSATSAISAWTTAGFPANQIVLGVPAYAHSFTVPSSTALSNNQIQLYTSFSGVPQGDAWDYIPAGSMDSCGNPVGPNGVFNFWALYGYGYLNSDGSPASGVVSTFDNCSQTPFLYDTASQLLISYDNPQSFTAKGQFIKSKQLAGFAMYEVGGDYNNLLASAIRNGMSG